MIQSSFSRLLTLVCVCGLVAVAGVACGPDTNGNNGGGSITPEEAQDEINELLADSFCKSFYQCPEEQDPQSVLFASRYETEEACSENILSAFGFPSDDTLSRDVEAGLIEWDGAKGRECIDALKDTLSDPCGDLFSGGEEPEACAQAVQGTQPMGAACDSDDHCQSGYCDSSVETGDDACWIGECAEEPEEEILAEGDDCSTGGTCDPEQNLVCDTDANNQGSICVAEDSRAEDESCRATSVCESGLACIDGACTSLALGAQGDACDLETTYCQPGLICRVNSVSQMGLDAECAPPLDEGEDCYLDVSCKPGLQCEGADVVSDTAGSCDSMLKSEGED